MVRRWLLISPDVALVENKAESQRQRTIKTSPWSDEDAGGIREN
jgi:hypothetical protein